MKDNKEQIRNIVSLIIFVIIGIVLTLFLFRIMVVFTEETTWRNDNFCELKYGTNERDSEKFFGKFCAEVDYKNYKVIKHYYTHEEMMNYCGRISFWELNKWEGKCG